MPYTGEYYALLRVPGCTDEQVDAVVQPLVAAGADVRLDPPSPRERPHRPLTALLVPTAAGLSDPRVLAAASLRHAAVAGPAWAEQRLPAGAPQVRGWAAAAGAGAGAESSGRSAGGGLPPRLPRDCMQSVVPTLCCPPLTARAPPLCPPPLAGAAGDPRARPGGGAGPRHGRFQGPARAAVHERRGRRAALPAHRRG